MGPRGPEPPHEMTVNISSFDSRRAQLKDQKMSPKKQNNTETKINRKETQINRNETLNYQIGESGGFKYDSPYENVHGPIFF